MNGLSHLVFERTCILTDSKINLSRIHKCSTNWKPFVANRVQEIHDHFQRSQCFHIPGTENPADFLSRGMSIEKLKESSLLWYGPSWLSLPSHEWPKCDEDSAVPLECEDEAKKCKVIVTT